MTAGDISRPREPARNEVANTFFEHTSAKRINTNAVMVEAIRKEYPQLHLTVVPQGNCDLVAYASAGYAGLAKIDGPKERLSEKRFIPPYNRSIGSGLLAEKDSLAKYLLDWENKEFVVYVADGRDDTEPFPIVNLYVLSPSVEATNRLLLAAGKWNSQLHNEVWVFDQGYWQKSAGLWESVQRAHWADVILEKKMKDAIINDVENFFDAKQTYDNLHVAWKRGIIYHGPPGNGKTISLKAMMHSLYDRKPEPIPTLYVRSLSSFGGPEYSLNQIFSLARRFAPCFLIFEDLDSIVTDNVRSYFLNEVDGIKPNDGILMVGSTNHLDRLDPGISKRPSRFDRKYYFPNPNESERVQYMHYWQKKLSDNEDLEFPDKLCPAVAKITDGFSFAYMQEAMVASLLAVARDGDYSAEKLCLECMECHSLGQGGVRCDRDAHMAFKGLYDWVWKVRRLDDEDRDLDSYVLWREIKKQVRILREEMGGDKDER